MTSLSERRSWARQKKYGVKQISSPAYEENLHYQMTTIMHRDFINNVDRISWDNNVSAFHREITLKAEKQIVDIYHLIQQMKKSYSRATLALKNSNKDEVVNCLYDLIDQYQRYRELKNRLK